MLHAHHRNYNCKKGQSSFKPKPRLDLGQDLAQGFRIAWLVLCHLRALEVGKAIEVASTLLQCFCMTQTNIRTENCVDIEQRVAVDDQRI